MLWLLAWEIVMVSEDRSFYVYVYFRMDGSPCYVGKGKGRRWTDHERKAENPRLGALLSRAGGTLPRVKVREGLTNEEAAETERAFIAAIGRGKNGPLVNMTDGGEGAAGRRHTDAAKAAISAAQKGRRPSEEARARMSASQTGRKHTPETLAKIGAGNRGKVISEAQREAVGRAHRGRRLTAEHKAKIADGQRGRKQAPEHVAKRAAATAAKNRGRKASMETREKMRQAHLRRHALRHSTMTCDA